MRKRHWIKRLVLGVFAAAVIAALPIAGFLYLMMPRSHISSDPGLADISRVTGIAFPLRSRVSSSSFADRRMYAEIEVDSHDVPGFLESLRKTTNEGDPRSGQSSSSVKVNVSTRESKSIAGKIPTGAGLSKEWIDEPNTKLTFATVDRSSEHSEIYIYSGKGEHSKILLFWNAF